MRFLSVLSTCVLVMGLWGAASDGAPEQGKRAPAARTGDPTDGAKIVPNERNLPGRAGDVKQIADRFKGTRDLAGAAEALVNGPGGQFHYGYGVRNAGKQYSGLADVASLQDLFAQRLLSCYEFVHYVAYLTSGQRVTATGGPMVSTAPGTAYRFLYEAQPNYGGRYSIDRGKVVVFKGWLRNNTAGYFHVGISLGNGKVAHLSSDGDMQISDLNDVARGYRAVEVGDYPWNQVADRSPDALGPPPEDAAATPGSQPAGTTGTNTPGTSTPGTTPGTAPAGNQGANTTGAAGSSTPTGAPAGRSATPPSAPPQAPSSPPSPPMQVPEVKQAMEAAPAGLRVADDNACCGDPLGTLMTIPDVPTTTRYQLFVTGAPIDRALEGSRSGPDHAPAFAAVSMLGLSSWLRGAAALLGAQPPVTEGPSVSLIATGASTGDAFEVRIDAGAAYSGRIVAPQGLVLEATTVMVPATGGVAARDTSQLNGFCAEFQKDPPPPGTVYRVANAAQQARLKPLRKLLDAADQLSAAGRLHPDTNPATYVNFVKQYAMWTRLEGWNADAFARNFVARTKKNVEAANQPWTAQVEAEVKKRVPSRWADIQSVLQTVLQGAQ